MACYNGFSNMTDEPTYDRVDDTSDASTRRQYWDMAFGLQQVDGLEPSTYMRQLADEHVDGRKTYSQVYDEITNYYHKNSTNHEDDREEEADSVSTAIYSILDDQSFRFDIMTLKNYHRRLFTELDHRVFNPGEFRTYNITKREPILDSDTVQYQSFDLIQASLEYDFNEERAVDYAKLNSQQLVDRMAEFTSRIWQVHPFQEGNTRTTAVFIQKYLRSMGFQVNNELFKDHSLYFRNASVRANYMNYPKGISETRQYLNRFFENLLLCKNYPLDNDDLRV